MKRIKDYAIGGMSGVLITSGIISMVSNHLYFYDSWHLLVGIVGLIIAMVPEKRS